MVQRALAYDGFCGYIQFPVKGLQVKTYCHTHTAPSSIPYMVNQAAQSISLQQDIFAPLPQLKADEHLFLAGLVLPVTAHVLATVEKITNALKDNHLNALPSGDYCGCFITLDAVWFFKSRTSNTTIFYTHHNGSVKWSTNPRDLVTSQNIDTNALVQCCMGNDIFVFYGIERVHAGTVVRIDQLSVQNAVFDEIKPLALPHRVALPELSVLCHEAVSEATRPLTSLQCKIGILLSGGIDSSVVAAALVEHGADVVAYHFSFSNTAADESAYAKAVCQALSIPFIPIHVSIGSDYLSEDWRFPHPYNHAGMRWFEQAADQMQKDGISILTTGRGGDISFGPQYSYGLYDIFSAPISLKEKLAMLSGALSTDWILPELLKSIRTSSSLINESSLSSTTDSQSATQEVPFFRQHTVRSFQDHLLYDVTRFSPQDLALETSIWQPHGIRVVHPYHQAAVQQLSASLPNAYRLIPFQGMKVVKPVLRLAYASCLPPSVVRYRRGAWLSVPSQEYCISFAPYLARLLSSPTSQVVQQGIIDPLQLQKVLSSERSIRTYYKVLIATAMTELFLRHYTNHS